MNKLPSIKEEQKRGINIIYLESNIFDMGINYTLSVEIITKYEEIFIERIDLFSGLGEDIKGFTIKSEDILKHLK